MTSAIALLLILLGAFAMMVAGMTKRVKLTKAQRELLEGIAVESTVVGLGYKPAAKLVELGFAEIIPRRLGAPRLQITPAGRAYLAEDGA